MRFIIVVGAMLLVACANVGLAWAQSANDATPSDPRQCLLDGGEWTTCLKSVPFNVTPAPVKPWDPTQGAVAGGDAGILGAWRFGSLWVPEPSELLWADSATGRYVPRPPGTPAF